jgi:hypothetical protein
MLSTHSILIVDLLVLSCYRLNWKNSALCAYNSTVKRVQKLCISLRDIEYIYIKRGCFEFSRKTDVIIFIDMKWCDNSRVHFCTTFVRSLMP